MNIGLWSIKLEMILTFLVPTTQSGHFPHSSPTPEICFRQGSLTDHPPFSQQPCYGRREWAGDGRCPRSTLDRKGACYGSAGRIFTSFPDPKQIYGTYHITEQAKQTPCAYNVTTLSGMSSLSSKGNQDEAHICDGIWGRAGVVVNIYLTQ